MCSHGMYWFIPLDAGDLELVDPAIKIHDAELWEDEKKEIMKRDWMEENHETNRL